MCILFWKKKKKDVKSNTVVYKPVQGNGKSEVEKSVKIQKYHVSQNKNEKAENFMKWRVRKEGSNKSLQFFDTQKLAIDFAQDLADKFGSTIVIHKRDGSIRKQDYTK